MDETPAVPLPALPAPLKFRRPEAALADPPETVSIPDGGVNPAAAMVPFDGEDDTDKGDGSDLPEDLELEDIKRIIKTETQKMLRASGAQLTAIVRKLQRLRVAKMLLTEVEGPTDPALNRELQLLNKLMAAEGADGDDGNAQDEAAARERVKQLLRDRGGSPQAAERIARVLSSVMGQANAFTARRSASAAAVATEDIPDDDLDNPRVDEQLGSSDAGS